MPDDFGLSNEIKAKMIQSAHERFHSEGAKVTTPEEVVQALGGTLNQFYYDFQNKEGLIREVIRAEFEVVKSGRTPICYEFASWTDLEKWFLAHVELQRSTDMTRTCLFGKVGNEIAERDIPIREEVSAIFEFMKTRIAAFFKKEKALGRLAKDVNEGSLSDFCIATLQGAMLLGKVKQNSKPVEGAFREALTHLKHYSIVANKK